MSPQQKIDDLIEAGLTSGFFTHSYVACGRFDEPASRYESQRAAENPQSTIFDLASLTKALVTGVLVHRMLSRHKLSDETSMSQWPFDRSRLQLPAPFWDLRISALLGHYAGVPAWINFWMGHLNESSGSKTLEERATLIARVLTRVPISLTKDEADLYSDVGYILLGSLLELSEDRDLSQQFDDFKLSIGVPSSTTLRYAVDGKRAQNQYISTGFCALRQRRLVGEVHDENAAALGRIAGHAGLFGSGPDLINYLRALFRHPLGHSYLEANHLARIQTHHEGLKGLRRGSGASAVLFAEGQSMGHLGFTGTAFWLHYETGRYGIWLSNRVISGRISHQMQDYRRQIFGYLHEILL